MQLIKHPRFLEEYKTWSAKISSIKDDTKRAELSRSLQNLVSEVKKLDSYHNEFAVTVGMSASVNESRQNISDIRKKISKQIKELEAAGLIETQCS